MYSQIISCRLSMLRNSVQFQQVRNLRNRRESKAVLPVPKMRKRLDIVILGVPNVGKSVLLNSMLRTKVAATNKKRHSTRKEILGVFNCRNTQLAFYDTPGYVKKEEAMKKDTQALRKVAEAAVTEKADVVLLMVDATKCKGIKYQDTFAEMAQMAIDHAKLEVILVINKVDLVEPKSVLLAMTRELVGLINYVKLGVEKKDLAQLDTTTFMISALHNDGVLDLKNYLISVARPKPWVLAPDNGPTDLSNEERVEEMVRQMLMDHTHEEIPYIASLECTSIATLRDMRIQIDVDIYVDSGRQKKIVLGQSGRTMIKVRQMAAKELEQIFGQQVILQLWVKVRGKSNNDIAEEDE